MGWWLFADASGGGCETWCGDVGEAFDWGGVFRLSGVDFGGGCGYGLTVCGEALFIGENDELEPPFMVCSVAVKVFVDRSDVSEVLMVIGGPETSGLEILKADGQVRDLRDEF